MLLNFTYSMIQTCKSDSLLIKTFQFYSGSERDRNTENHESINIKNIHNYSDGGSPRVRVLDAGDAGPGV